MARVLISTVYSAKPTLYACTKERPDKLILLVPEEADKTVEEALKVIGDSVGSVLDTTQETIAQYDIVAIARTAAKAIDEHCTEKDEVILNITSGRKTQSLGLLYAGYARARYVRKIAYYPEEKDRVVVLPVLPFKLTESQSKILASLGKEEKTYAQLGTETKLSTAMVYRAIDELIHQGYVEKTERKGLRITDAGEIARM